MGVTRSVPTRISYQSSSFIYLGIESRQNDDRSRSTYDGFHGVDSEDILNIPQIGFSTFQLFPDQVVYATTDCKQSPFNQTVHAGIDWIKRQTAVGAR